jgi:hypothetical protein
MIIIAVDCQAFLENKGVKERERERERQDSNSIERDSTLSSLFFSLSSFPRKKHTHN